MRENNSPLTRTILTLLGSNPIGPLEICNIAMEPIESPTSAIEMRHVSPSAFALALPVGRIPPRVHSDRPLEIELDSVSLGTCASVADSVARFISAHARLEIAIDVPGRLRATYDVPLTVRPSGKGWTARALLHPSSWTDVASTDVIVIAFTLMGRSLLSDCLPATLHVGYNHASAPQGAVYAAAQAGDVRALQAALDAGGSTEEADYVSGGGDK